MEQLATATHFPANPASPGDDAPICGLVIEDDQVLREWLCDLLGALGIGVQGVDREQGIEALVARQAVQVVDGARRSPMRPDTPRLRVAPGHGLVLLTAQVAATPSRLGRHGGRQVELPAVDQILGHLGSRCHVDAPPADAGDRWTYDAARWRLTAPNGQSVQLSPAESQVIRCLFERKGEVAGRDELLTALNRPHLEAYSRNLDVTVSRLRKKVESWCRQKLPLTSARSRGYAFHAPVSILS